MKKSFKIIFLLLYLLLLDNSIVFADTYHCYYEYDTNALINPIMEFDVVIDTTNKKIILEQVFDYDGALLDSALDSSWTEQKLIEEYLYDKEKDDYICPSYVYGCSIKDVKHSNNGDTFTTNKRFPLINQNLIDLVPDGNDLFLESISDYNGKTNPDGHEYYLVAGQECVGASYISGKSDKNAQNLGIPCDIYDKMYDNLKNLACENVDDISTCNIENVDDIQLYNNLRNKIKEYCNIRFKYSIYEDNCVKSCLNLSKDIEILERERNEKGPCGISQKLALYIRNIVKWLKYIIPVLVIVLGILDFIKAISADKDDEMKKAQGKFVKRLIAAVLIFIIPFIIEFVLDKMGFEEYVSGCGIIDL